jgi:hypothetical protein
VLRNISVGESIILEGPFGVFTPRVHEDNLVFIAGGVGITPFMSILREALNTNIKNTSIALFYSVKNKEDLLFESELEAINPDGTNPELHPATVGENVTAEKITAIEALNLKFDTTYSLESEQLPPGLKTELDAGSIFRFPFNPRADYQVETGILVSNENGYFALIGQTVEYQYSALSSVVSVVDEAASDSSDDLDFEMF